MKRALLSLCILIAIALRAAAIGPPIVSLTTDATGTKYRLHDSVTTRPEIIELFAQEKPLSAQPVMIFVDAATPFFTVYDFLTEFKERAGVGEFWVTVYAELKGDQPARVIHRFAITAAQLTRPERELLPPPESPGAPLQYLKPWTPAPQKIPPQKVPVPK